MKRTRSLALTGLMATASLSLTACGGRGASGDLAEAQVYRTLADCKIARPRDGAACDTAYAQARKDDEDSGGRYATLQDCEIQQGYDQCQERPASGGHPGYYGPRMSGFAIGRFGSGGLERGAPFYADAGSTSSGSVGNGGGRLRYDYAKGRYLADAGAFSGDPVVRASPRGVSMSGARSRGGFGGFGGRGGFGG